MCKNEIYIHDKGKQIIKETNIYVLSVFSTLKCIRGKVHKGETRKGFSAFIFGKLSVTHLLVKKNTIGCAIFSLISKNGHYCAMSQNLFGTAIFKQNIVFSNFI